MATGTRPISAVAAPVAILDLELALLRQQRAREDWNLMAAAEELSLMQRIRQKADWPAEFTEILGDLDASLVESLQTVRNKDTTRLQAAHTRLQRAVFALRDLLYR